MNASIGKIFIIRENHKSIFQNFPVLEIGRFALREIYPSDASALYAILSDEAVTEYYDDDPFTDLAQAEEQINAWGSGYKNRRVLRWGITLKSEDALLGTCGYYGVHAWHLRAAIGYELARSHWRQGIMTEALAAILAYGFKELQLNRVEALVMPENFASIKLLENLGFSNEGLLAQYENWGGKEFVDLIMFGLLNSGGS